MKEKLETSLEFIMHKETAFLVHDKRSCTELFTLLCI